MRMSGWILPSPMTLDLWQQGLRHWWTVGSTQPQEYHLVSHSRDTGYFWSSTCTRMIPLLPGSKHTICVWTCHKSHRPLWIQWTLWGSTQWHLQHWCHHWQYCTLRCSQGYGTLQSQLPHYLWKWTHSRKVKARVLLHQGEYSIQPRVTASWPLENNRNLSTSD